jgi:hypothetical protein
MEYGLVPRRNPQNLLIHGGAIQCPSRGDVGVEVCLWCRHMRRLTGGDDGSVVCDFHADTMSLYDPGIPRGWTGGPKR